MIQRLMIWILFLALIVFSLGGFYGGVAMLLDPSGNTLSLEAELDSLPVSDYVLPGIFLFVVMGAIPLFLAIALSTRMRWAWATNLTAWSQHHWAWTGTVLFTFVVAIWLLYEGSLIGWYPITYVTGINALVILILALTPPVRQFYIMTDI
jgi:hypothetical protein